MADFDSPDEFSNNLPENEWDLDWDEYWDQDSVLSKNNPEGANLDASKKPTFKKNPRVKKFDNKLEEVLEGGFEYEFTSDLNWGVIDDTKPTNLNSRLKSFLSAPFSTVLEPKKPKTTNTQTDISKNKIEPKNQNKKEKVKIQIRPPKIHSTIGDSHRRKDQVVIEASDLAFNNLNNVSRNELSEINNLLEGSLGKRDSVKFDNEIVQEKNINFVAQERILSKKKEEPPKISKDILREQILSAEQTIDSEVRLGETLVPGLNDIRFDLKSAQETSHLFDQNEINEILERIPAEKAKFKKEKIKISNEKEKQVLEQEKLGADLFESNLNTSNLDNSSSSDNLLDSILDEIDGEAKDDLLEDTDASESNVESLSKDEVITEKNIIDDDSDAALEFMDSAAQEAESLFEDFFKQGTAGKEKDIAKKVSYLDIIKIKVNELKALYKLCIRFVKEPKYFLEYFNITIKDIFVAVGLIFMLIAYTGLIHLQFITEKFPMNLF